MGFFSDPDSTPEILANKILPSVDGLRGISILIVIIAHINAHYGIQSLHHLFAAGIVGVYMFFVISGFLITTLLIKEKRKTGTISLRKFYSRRTLRIFPLAYLYIATIAVLSVIFSIQISGLDFTVAILYLANFTQFYTPTYLLHHFWSLAVEEQFYLFIAPLLKLKLRTVKWIIVLLLPGTFFIRFLLNTNPDSVICKLFFDLTRCIDGLLIGSLFAFLAFSNKVPWRFLKKYAEALSLCCVGLILLLKTDVNLWYLKPFFNHTFYSIFIGILILVNIQPNESWFFKLINSKLLIQVGLLSYSLYMWQQLFTDHSLMQYFPLNIIALPIVAWLSYNYFEKPFLKLKAKFSVV